MGAIIMPSTGSCTGGDHRGGEQAMAMMRRSTMAMG